MSFGNLNPVNDDMEVPTKRLKFLIIGGVLAGLLVNMVINQDFLLTLVALSKGVTPHDVYIMNFENGSCSFFKPEIYLPASKPHLLNDEGYECPELYQSFVLEQRIDLINSSTDNERVKKTLNNASKRLDAENVDEVARMLEKIETEKSYFIEE